MTTDVAIFAPKYPPDVGGAAVYFEQVVRQLEDSQWTATVFAPRRSDCADRADLTGGATLQRCFPSGLVHGAAFVPECARLLRSKPFACVHVHPHFPQWRFYRWVVKALNIPRVYDCRDRTFTRRFVTDGSYYLSATRHIDDLLAGEVGVPGEKIARSPVVVELPDDIPRVSFDGAGEHIGFIGDLTAAKGVQHAVESVRVYRETPGAQTKLHIYGDGPLSRWVKLQARGCEWLRYHGAVDRAQVLGAIDALDVVVAPSVTEGRPRVVLEARALGTPVVGSDAGDIPEIVGSQSVVVERDARKIADGIGRCLANRGSGARSDGGEEALADVGEAVISAYTTAM